MRQALIQWEGLTDENNSWEYEDLLRQYFPSLNLEGKVSVNEGGNGVNGRQLNQFKGGHVRRSMVEESAPFIIREVEDDEAVEVGES